MLDDPAVAAAVGGVCNLLPRPIVDPADEGYDLCSSCVLNGAVDKPDAVAGRCADIGCIKLRLRLLAPLVSGTWPGILVAIVVVAIVGGAGSGSRLIVVVVGGMAAVVPTLLMGIAYAELLMDIPSGPRTVAAAEYVCGRAGGRS